MKGIECPICHGRCDPGEMIGGVCLECREEERQEEELADEETVVIHYGGGGKRTVNIALDSATAIIRDVARVVD